MTSPTIQPGSWKYGLFLSLVTCAFWGILPIMLTGLMDKMDPITITFYRFVIASLLLLVWMLGTQKNFGIQKLGDGTLLLGTLGAISMLIINYALYVLALEKMSPTGAQVLIQLAPILLLLSGVFIFKEVFLPLQWAGLFIFLTGLCLFFWTRIIELTEKLTEYGLGMLLMVGAAISWAIYASLQKQLLSQFSSVQIMLFFNIVGSIVFLTVAKPLLVLSFNWFELLILILCGINSLAAYGCFTEALRYWEASKISALFSIVPLLTFIFIELLNLFTALEMKTEPFTITVIIGALLVVTGAACTSLGQQLSKK